MARPRNPERDKAFEIWRDSGGNAKLKEIAEQIGVPDSRIRKWKTEDNWEEKIKERSDSNKGALLNSKGSAPKRGAPKGNHNAVGHGAPKGNQNSVGKGAPKGNQNAVGNDGGAPPGNKNAVTTGEYETIWWDCLTPEEQELCRQIDTDPLSQTIDSIKLTSIREYRMMNRINNIINGKQEKGRKVKQELITHKEIISIYNEKAGKTSDVVVPVPKLTVSEIEEVEPRKTDDILRHEEALTRVQQYKVKLISLRHEIDSPASGSTGRNQNTQPVQIVDDIPDTGGESNAAG